eukprot:c23500_g1_i1 orf=87-956(+)
MVHLSVCVCVCVCNHQKGFLGCCCSGAIKSAMPFSLLHVRPLCWPFPSPHCSGQSIFCSSFYKKVRRLNRVAGKHISVHQHNNSRLGVIQCIIANSHRSSITLPPVSISATPAAVDLAELSALLAATGQNCLQFPGMERDGTLQPVNPLKLKLALENSTVVVSMYIRGDIPGGDYMDRHVENVAKVAWFNPFLLQRATKKLVAFGRATSDCSFTASIYDLAVAPSLQRLGLGGQVVQRLIRELTRRGVSDISVLALPEIRPFFEACGFAPDVLNSTAMIYRQYRIFLVQ